MVKKTCGWKFLVLWNDGSETWVPLKDMKESHPMEIAEFAKSRGIDKEPAFAWWIPYALQKLDIAISAINTLIRKSTHKYVIEIPISVKHAPEMDLKNGIFFCVKAIKKEIINVGIDFEILDKDKSVPVRWSKESGHLISMSRWNLPEKPDGFWMVIDLPIPLDILMLE